MYKGQVASAKCPSVPFSERNWDTRILYVAYGHGHTFHPLSVPVAVPFPMAEQSERAAEIAAAHHSYTAESHIGFWSRGYDGLWSVCSRPNPVQPPDTPRLRASVYCYIAFMHEPLRYHCHGHVTSRWGGRRGGGGELRPFWTEVGNGGNGGEVIGPKRKSMDPFRSSLQRKIFCLLTVSLYYLWEREFPIFGKKLIKKENGFSKSDRKNSEEGSLIERFRIYDHSSSIILYKGWIEGFCRQFNRNAKSEAEIDEGQNKRRLKGQEALRRGRFRPSLMCPDLDPDVIATME